MPHEKEGIAVDRHIGIVFRCRQRAARIVGRRGQHFHAAADVVNTAAAVLCLTFLNRLSEPRLKQRHVALEPWRRDVGHVVGQHVEPLALHVRTFGR